MADGTCRGRLRTPYRRVARAADQRRVQPGLSRRGRCRGRTGAASRFAPAGGAAHLRRRRGHGRGGRHPVPRWLARRTRSARRGVAGDATVCGHPRVRTGPSVDAATHADDLRGWHGRARRGRSHLAGSDKCGGGGARLRVPGSRGRGAARGGPRRAGRAGPAGLRRGAEPGGPAGGTVVPAGRRGAGPRRLARPDRGGAVGVGAAPARGCAHGGSQPARPTRPTRSPGRRGPGRGSRPDGGGRGVVSVRRRRRSRGSSCGTGGPAGAASARTACAAPSARCRG